MGVVPCSRSFEHDKIEVSHVSEMDSMQCVSDICGDLGVVSSDSDLCLELYCR
jgi:hypothetical protein